MRYEKTIVKSIKYFLLEKASLLVVEMNFAVRLSRMAMRIANLKHRSMVYDIQKLINIKERILNSNALYIMRDMYSKNI